MINAKLNKARWLHIPMEIVDRELYPKLFLASEAIDNGWNCVIGTKKALIAAADQLPLGVIYLKSVIPSEYNNMMIFKQNGHRLVSLDEEGLIQSSLETLVNARYCDKTVEETEKFFCWGDIPCNALKKHYKQYSYKFTATGSPTADLWSLKAKNVFQDKVDNLHERFGKYILIPSSFAVPNHFMGPEEALNIMKRDNMFRGEEDYQYYKRYHDYVEKVFHRFLDLLPILSKEFPDYTIILRPHPSDNYETWKNATKDLENIHVVFEGTVSPWLLGAQAILHWGSTTGLEAYLQGRPVIGYTPYPEEEKLYDVLPHLVSIMTHNTQEVLDTLHHVLDNPNDWLENYPNVIKGHKELSKWIYNIDNKPAIKNIMAELNEMQLEPQIFDGKVKTGVKTLTIKEIIWRILEVVGKVPSIFKIFPERFQIGIKSRKFGRHKTKDICEEEIKIALKQLSDTPMAIKKLDDNLYYISKKQIE